MTINFNGALRAKYKYKDSRMNNLFNKNKLIANNAKKITLASPGGGLNETPVLFNLSIKINSLDISYSSILGNAFNTKDLTAKFYINSKLENLNIMRLIHKNNDSYFTKG